MNNPTATATPEAAAPADGDRAELYMQLARAVAAAEITRPRDQHRLRFRLEDALRTHPDFDGTDLWVLDQSSAWIVRARTERAEQAAVVWMEGEPSCIALTHVAPQAVQA